MANLKPCPDPEMCCCDKDFQYIEAKLKHSIIRIVKLVWTQVLQEGDATCACERAFLESWVSTSFRIIAGAGLLRALHRRSGLGETSQPLGNHIGFGEIETVLTHPCVGQCRLTRVSRNIDGIHACKPL